MKHETEKEKDADPAEVGGFFWTCERAIRKPDAFFSRPAKRRSRWRPVPFAMAVGAIAYPTAVLAEMLIRGELVMAGVFTALIVGPFAAIFGAYSGAALTHFWLFVVRGKTQPFRETLECVCYTSAAALLSVIPIAGAVLSIVWRGVTLSIGLKRAQRTTTGRAAFAAIAGFISPVLLALCIRAGAVEAFKMPSGSMIPTISMGDHFFVNKVTYGLSIPLAETKLFTAPPRRSDVIVLKFPENRAQDFVKRVIAVSGDSLEAMNGRPIINGWLAPHCYVGPFKNDDREGELFIEHLEDRSYFTLFDTNPDEQTCGAGRECGEGLACRGGICGVLQGPFKAATGEAWVMGDNRNNSHDSRSWRGGLGAGVPFEDIKGRAMFVWMSFGPHGDLAQDRLFIDLHDRPTPPRDQEAALGPAVEKCLRERPSAAETTPPAPGGARAD